MYIYVHFIFLKQYSVSLNTNCSKNFFWPFPCFYSHFLLRQATDFNAIVRHPRQHRRRRRRSAGHEFQLLVPGLGARVLQPRQLVAVGCWCWRLNFWKLMGLIWKKWKKVGEVLKSHCYLRLDSHDDSSTMCEHVWRVFQYHVFQWLMLNIFYRRQPQLLNFRMDVPDCLFYHILHLGEPSQWRDSQPNHFPM